MSCTSWYHLHNLEKLRLKIEVCRKILLTLIRNCIFFYETSVVWKLLGQLLDVKNSPQNFNLFGCFKLRKKIQQKNIFCQPNRKRMWYNFIHFCSHIDIHFLATFGYKLTSKFLASSTKLMIFFKIGTQLGHLTHTINEIVKFWLALLSSDHALLTVLTVKFFI